MTDELMLHITQLEKTIELIWCSEWSFSYKKEVADILMNQRDNLLKDDEEE